MDKLKSKINQLKEEWKLISLNAKSREHRIKEEVNVLKANLVDKENKKPKHNFIDKPLKVDYQEVSISKNEDLPL